LNADYELKGSEFNQIELYLILNIKIYDYPSMISLLSFINLSIF
jgi:hypothetical protein